MDDKELRQDVAAAVAAYEALIGGYATYTHRMLDQLGPVGTLSRLVAESRIQKGLKPLARAGRSQLSFEAVIIKHRHSFSKGVVDAAAWRLERAERGDFD